MPTFKARDELNDATSINGKRSFLMHGDESEIVYCRKELREEFKERERDAVTQ